MAFILRRRWLMGKEIREEDVGSEVEVVILVENWVYFEVQRVCIDMKFEERN